MMNKLFKKLKNKLSKKKVKDILYIDMDGVICDFDKKCLHLRPDLEKYSLDEQKLIKDKLQKTPHFYADLKPFPGAIGAILKLRLVYDVYILSTAAWDNPSCWTDKRVWIEKYFGDALKKRLILSHNKGLLMGRFLVDDRIKNGVEDFTGKHIHFGTTKFPDWDAVFSYLFSKLKK